MEFKEQDYLNPIMSGVEQFYKTREQVEQQKRLADYILTELTKEGIKVSLMGGAPRDWFMDKPASDLDFFVDSNKETLLYVLNKLGIKYKLKEPSGDYQSNPMLEAVYENTDQYIMPVQFMVVNSDLDTVMNGFPFGICKIRYDLKYGFRQTQQFINCWRNKVLICTGDLYSDQKTYTEKIRNKFPDFKFYHSADALVKDLF